MTRQHWIVGITVGGLVVSWMHPEWVSSIMLIGSGLIFLVMLLEGS